MVYASRRRGWGAKGTGGSVIGPVGEVIIHTEAGAVMAVGSTRAQEMARMRAIDAFHLSLGWSGGFGYSAGINPLSRKGRIHEGRGYGRSGAHTQGKNSSSLAVVLFGHGDRHGITSEAKTAIGGWIRHGQKSDVTAIRSEVTVTGHRRYANKTCPGTKVTDADLADIQMRAGQRPPVEIDVALPDLIKGDQLKPADHKAIADDVLARMPKPPTAEQIAAAVLAKLQPDGGAALGDEVDLARRQLRRHQRLLAWLITTIAAIAGELGLDAEPPDDADANPIV